VLGRHLGYDAARVTALETAGVLHSEPVPGTTQRCV